LRALNKPLLAILVTHPHPDHFNGVFGLVQDKEVPVYAAASVARVITEIAEAKREQWSPTYGAEWPAETYYPNSPLSDRGQVRFGELTFTVRELGAAESHADSYFLLAAAGHAPVAFTGDLAFRGMHSYTADGHSARWLPVLDAVAGELAAADQAVSAAVS
jgi:glyoxylase-like metal-dependent hydrolase (beta-lactamase superfamily II)